MLAPKPRIPILAALPHDDEDDGYYRPLAEALILGCVVAAVPEAIRAYREHRARQWAEDHPELCGAMDPTEPAKGDEK